MTDETPKPEYPKAMQKGGQKYMAQNAQDFAAHRAIGWTEATPVADSEFPRAVHKSGGASKSVRTEAELEEALKDGWSKMPVVEAEKQHEQVPAAPATGEAQ